MNCCSMRGKQGDEHFAPTDPPRRRATKQRGRGTYANARPPSVGTIGRETGQVRLRVTTDTTGRTLRAQVHHLTQEGTHVFTDADDSYNGIERVRSTVAHGQAAWARDDDGAGIREVHPNTAEGMGTGLRTFLRPFRGVHKRLVSGYVAIHALRINLKRISISFIAALVDRHSLYS
jgi:transposase